MAEQGIEVDEAGADYLGAGALVLALDAGLFEILLQQRADVDEVA